jgi:Retroviral aspartyl protease
MIMLDKENTHSFINTSIMHDLSLPTYSCPILVVTTPSDNNLSTSIICVGL